jgi:hypothetical protein
MTTVYSSGLQDSCCCEVRDGGAHGCEVGGGVAACFEVGGGGSGAGSGKMSPGAGEFRRKTLAELRPESGGWSGTIAPSSRDSGAFCFDEHNDSFPQGEIRDRGDTGGCGGVISQ